MTEKKEGYIDNKEFNDLLKQYEQLTNDVSEWWRKIDPDKKAKKKSRNGKDVETYNLIFKRETTFKKRKEDNFKARHIRIANETLEEAELREKKLERVKNKIGKMFLLISSNFIKRPNFINYDPYRKDTMISDAALFMYSYIERYDTNLSNPLSYFTQVATSAFLQNINKNNKNSDMFTPISFLDNLGEGEYISED